MIFHSENNGLEADFECHSIPGPWFESHFHIISLDGRNANDGVLVQCQTIYFCTWTTLTAVPLTKTSTKRLSF